ncbi:hypothetical protein BpHYR1_048849, partial [Brachionus plicatilis]
MELNDYDLLQGKKSVVEEMQQELSRLREETEFLKNQSAKLSSFGKVAASLDWDLNLGIKIICFRNGWFSTERNNIFKTCRGGDRGRVGCNIAPPSTLETSPDVEGDTVTLQLGRPTSTKQNKINN